MRVFDDIGIPAPSLRTISRTLARSIDERSARSVEFLLQGRHCQSAAPLCKFRVNEYSPPSHPAYRSAPHTRHRKSPRSIPPSHRWTDPISHDRRSYSATFESEDKARTFLEQLHRTFLEQLQSRTHIAIDPLISLADYVAEIRDRYLRGLDPSSTASGYRGSIRVRVLPALGHLAVRSISTAAIGRTIDRWEGNCSPSTLKNTVSALTRVLDEAVRDEIIAANPARTRARRRTRSSTADVTRKIPTLGEVQSLADGCRRVHAAYGDFVLLSALLAARVSEVAGLVISDIDWDNRLVTIARQDFPGSNGLCLKPAKSSKSRQTRRVPILNRCSDA